MTSTSCLVLKHKDILSNICKLPTKQRKKVLQKVPREILNAISEVFKNFLKCNLNVDSKLIKKFKKHKSGIRKIALKKTTLKSKKQFLSSRVGGSILAALIPMAISAVTSLFNRS